MNSSPPPSSEADSAPAGHTVQTLTGHSTDVQPPSPQSSYPGRNGRGRGRGRAVGDARNYRRLFRSQRVLLENCQLCGADHHVASACRRFFAGAAPSGRFSRQYAPPPANVPHSAEATWYPDTGTTHHVTPDIDDSQSNDDLLGPDS